MSWIYLFIAGLFEIAWVYSLKLSEGFSRLVPSIATFTLLIASFIFLSLAMKELPMGTSYAVWTGIGAVGAVLIGILFLGESKDILRFAFVALIAIGIVGLKLTSKS